MFPFNKLSHFKVGNIRPNTDVLFCLFCIVCHWPMLPFKGNFVEVRCFIRLKINLCNIIRTF